MKMHVKKGDTVIVISGEAKGDQGRIIEVDRKNNRVVVEGLNLKTKYAKPVANNPGGLSKLPGGIHVSNVALLSDGKATRIGRKEEKGTTVRFSRKTGKSID